MKIYSSKDISKEKLNRLFSRPAIDSEKILESIAPVVKDVKKNGIKAALKYARKYDQFTGEKFLVSKREFVLAENKIDRDTKNAFKIAARNIEKFHCEQKPLNYKIETIPGVSCSREFRAVENVALYIPGGTAVLPSTLLMLAIPARLAGCKRVAALSPTNKNIDPVILYAAKLCGVDEFYKIGGGHGIALLAYGDGPINKVDKIFGPGNQYVTSAKALVSTDPDGCAIDMPAGPSELLIIADNNADSSYIAADLLSQAEHGKDSQVILITTSEKLSKEVNKEIELQIKYLHRNDFIREALKNSFALVVKSIDEAVTLSNIYAPEHLILNVQNPERLTKKISNAGSVFLGKYSAESIGDYASGTNHSLPTYGYAKSYGGISVESFMKTITFQKISSDGLKRIAPIVIKMALTEKLDAHANAVKVRMNYEN